MNSTNCERRLPDGCWSRRREKGYALITVMIFSALSLVVLGSALTWTSTNVRLTQRNNTYFTAVAACEAATEKVLTAVSSDYRSKGESEVYNRLNQYVATVPTSSENGYWSGFEFSDGKGGSGKTYVDRVHPWVYTNLMSQYKGLMGMAATYRIVSNAKAKDFTGTVSAGMMQTVQVASVPIFQFAIFYTPDLEINPGPNMTIDGRVHTNSKLYTQPQAALVFKEDVTAADKIVKGKSPLDPSSRSPGTITYEGEHDAYTSSLTLPIGTNNSPEAVRAVVELPPAGESVSSAMGKERYYNKVDIIVEVSSGGVSGYTGLFNSFGTVIPASDLNKFISTATSFYNKREGKTVKSIDVNVSALKKYSETNTVVKNHLKRDISSLYILDKRSHSSSSQSGVRMMSGQTLPNLGLTVATPSPAYVWGHYNVPNSALGTSDTSGSKPASIIADAITILSSAWDDADSTKALSERKAASTTINAAFLAGIVPSDGANYSGGVENFPRFLEDWGDDTFTYNGSMVVMFYSEVAKAPWGGSDVYSPPKRNWTFDKNYKDPTKLPPCTPQLLTLIRGKWAMLTPGTIPAL